MIYKFNNFYKIFLIFSFLGQLWGMETNADFNKLQEVPKSWARTLNIIPMQKEYKQYIAQEYTQDITLCILSVLDNRKGFVSAAELNTKRIKVGITADNSKDVILEVTSNFTDEINKKLNELSLSVESYNSDQSKEKAKKLLDSLCSIKKLADQKSIRISSMAYNRIQEQIKSLKIDLFDKENTRDGTERAQFVAELTQQDNEKAENAKKLALKYLWYLKYKVLNKGHKKEHVDIAYESANKVLKDIKHDYAISGQIEDILCQTELANMLNVLPENYKPIYDVSKDAELYNPKNNIFDNNFKLKIASLVTLSIFGYKFPDKIKSNISLLINYIKNCPAQFKAYVNNQLELAKLKIIKPKNKNGNKFEYTTANIIT